MDIRRLTQHRLLQLTLLLCLLGGAWFQAEHIHVSDSVSHECLACHYSATAAIGDGESFSPVILSDNVDIPLLEQASYASPRLLPQTRAPPIVLS
ncbi:hypothetical protein IB286_04760 [Spongiibacter sp. KMU-158]|uniref:Uncharacterized protein n=1 Tax=Spongiibacter pelagi TaxID=2760804 RepID=A0A927C1T5_9GAMM|nr:hypothetical protein [Spongiibacter pelagi]MBD2858312.1 hypothetical protein [Spongiibacter pelagi]